MPSSGAGRGVEARRTAPKQALPPPGRRSSASRSAAPRDASWPLKLCECRKAKSDGEAAARTSDSWSSVRLDWPGRADASAESRQGGRRRRAQLFTLRSALGTFESRTGMTMASLALEADPSASPACRSSASSSARLMVAPASCSCTETGAAGLAGPARDFDSGTCLDGSLWASLCRGARLLPCRGFRLSVGSGALPPPAACLTPSGTWAARSSRT